MDLEKYIEETIVSICNGIGNAKSKIANGAIAPVSVTDSVGNQESVHKIRTFDFEVIISVNSKNKLEVNGGVELKYGIKGFFNRKKASSSANQNVNKVCFSIPFLPEAIPGKYSKK